MPIAAAAGRQVEGPMRSNAAAAAAIVGLARYRAAAECAQHAHGILLRRVVAIAAHSCRQLEPALPQELLYPRERERCGRTGTSRAYTHRDPQLELASRLLRGHRAQ